MVVAYKETMYPLTASKEELPLFTPKEEPITVIPMTYEDAIRTTMSGVTSCYNYAEATITITKEEYDNLTEEKCI